MDRLGEVGLGAGGAGGGDPLVAALLDRRALSVSGSSCDRKCAGRRRRLEGGGVDEAALQVFPRPWGAGTHRHEREWGAAGHGSVPFRDWGDGYAPRSRVGGGARWIANGPRLRKRGTHPGVEAATTRVLRGGGTQAGVGGRGRNGTCRGGRAGSGVWGGAVALHMDTCRCVERAKIIHTSSSGLPWPERRRDRRPVPYRDEGRVGSRPGQVPRGPVDRAEGSRLAVLIAGRILTQARQL